MESGDIKLMIIVVSTGGGITLLIVIVLVIYIMKKNQKYDDIENKISRMTNNGRSPDKDIIQKNLEQETRLADEQEEAEREEQNIALMNLTEKSSIFSMYTVNQNMPSTTDR